VQAIFPKKRKEMKGLPWGLFYNQHGKRTDLDPKKLEMEVRRLMGDEDVTRKSGIYEYLLTGDERKLSIRAFDMRDRLAAYERQLHKCIYCGKTFESCGKRARKYCDRHCFMLHRNGHKLPNLEAI
jgi:tRNA(Ile2) C34 agmatinyltransferase TiaS